MQLHFDNFSSSIGILVCDDNKSIRTLITSIIKSLQININVFQAGDGDEAFEIFKKEKDNIHIAILDVFMPKMSGIELANLIKPLKNNEIFPIIFASALTDKESIIECHEIGHDFLTKPIDIHILKAKILSFVNLILAFRTISDQNNALSLMNDKVLQEEQMAGKLISRLIPEKNKFPEMQFEIRPGDNIAGDIVVAARDLANRLYVMVMDAAGHGLHAAVTLMPAVNIFSSMAMKGFLPEVIANEINNHHRNLFPINNFISAAILQIDFDLNKCLIWNGGMPSIFIRGKDLGLIKTIDKTGFPIGIVDNSIFNPTSENINLNKDDDIIIFSDGFSEPMGPLWDDLVKSNEFLTFNKAWDFFKGHEYHDDATLCFISNSGGDKNKVIHQTLSQHSELLDDKFWNGTFSLEFSTAELKSFGALYRDKYLSFLSAMGYSDVARNTTFQIVFNELALNALEHGVLKMNSIIKNTEDGLNQWDYLRKVALHKIEFGFIKISIKRIQDDIIAIKISDSGQGFNTKDVNILNDYSLINKYGRGIKLAASLAEKINYSTLGNCCAFIVKLK